MELTQLKTLWSHSRGYVKQHSAAILAGMGVVGVVATVYCAWTAAPKYEEIINEHHKAMEKVNPEDVETTKVIKRETAQDVVKTVLPVVVSAGATVGLIIGSQRINARRIAALSAAYSLSADMVKNLNCQIREELGPKKADEIKKKVYGKKIEDENGGKKPLRSDVMSRKALYWCRDYQTGNMFQANAAMIDKAINMVSARIANEMYITLSEFWYELQDAGALGCENMFQSKVGDIFGWNIDDLVGGQLDIGYTAVQDDAGDPILSLEYIVHPDTEEMISPLKINLG